MNGLTSRRGILQLLLWAIALHSIAVGIGLMLHPADLLASMGYAPVGEPFFPTQGGVFHLVMAVCYVLGAWRPQRNAPLIQFSIIVKFMALTFLVIYWIANPHLIMVLASGLIDGAMGLVLLLVYRRWRAAPDAPFFGPAARP